MWLVKKYIMDYEYNWNWHPVDSCDSEDEANARCEALEAQSHASFKVVDDS